MTEEVELHSPLGPSASERWLECPGSVLLTQDMPDSESSYAIEGTAAHLLAEKAFEAEKPAKDFLDQVILVERSDGTHTPITVDQEMVDGVQAFLDECLEPEMEGEFCEIRVRYDAWVPDGFGTTDYLGIKDGLAKLKDLKYGKGVQVYAKDNPQLKLYALGCYEDFGHLYDIDTFELSIVQPRLDHIDRWEIRTKDLLQWAEKTVKPIAAQALKPGAPVKAGEHCRFCRAKHVCRERARWVFEQTVGEFDVIEKFEVREATLMNNEEVALALHHVDAIRSWCNDLEAHAMSQVQQGHAVGDWKLVEGRSVRAWKEEEGAIEKRLRAAKLKVAQIFTKKLISPAQAEKVLGKGHPLMKELVHKPQGKPKLAPGDDPRPTLKVSPDEFDDINEDK